jgi:hypothetical protein
MTDFNSEIVVTVNKSDLGRNERLKDAVGGSTPFQICLISQMDLKLTQNKTRKPFH